jgi:hypothetical protein
MLGNIFLFWRVIFSINIMIEKILGIFRKHQYVDDVNRPRIAWPK